MRAIILLGSLLVIVGAAWTTLWFIAAHEAGHRIEARIDDEAEQGRVWTCPGRTIAGFPFALVVTCRHPLFAGRAFGEQVQGSLAALRVETSLMHPRSLALDLTAPFTYRTSDAQVDVTGAWTSLHAELLGLPDLRTLRLQGREVVVDGQFGPQGRQDGRVGALDAAFTISPDRADPTLDFTVKLDAVPLAALDALLGGSAPADVGLKGQLNRAHVEDARSPEEVIDAWRRAGGRLELSEASLTRGASRASAVGTLTLDDSHRPQGRLETTFTGAEPILARYGIGGNLAAAGSLLSSLFGGHKQVASPPGSINLPVNLRDGRLAIGPVRTQIALPPVY